jgi:RNA polymerase sigma-70 factor (ECF subfamily)
VKISEQIWQEYHSRLRAVILKRISDEAVTDDILQDVFLKLHTGLASLKDETKIQSWLFQFTRNTIIDYFRSRKPALQLPEWISESETDSDERVTRELSHCLQPMIHNLPESYRESIILSELKGLTQKDVAQIQGISLSGVKSRVQRGRARLKEMLAECCRLEFDHRGRLCCYEPKKPPCDDSC